MTKQEQIEKIQEIINDCYVVDSYIAAEGSEGGYIDTEKAAKAIVEAGYGDISEYRAEIERLVAEFKQLETNAEILARGVREFNHENYELTKKVKQAQVDTINTIIEYCKNPNHWNELKDCKLWGGKSDDLRVFLSGIFKESNDENTRTL